jgi:hypothetical protein
LVFVSGFTEYTVEERAGKGMMGGFWTGSETVSIQKAAEAVVLWVCIDEDGSLIEDFTWMIVSR